VNMPEGHPLVGRLPARESNTAHLDMPVEQLVRRRDTRFQLGFANEACQRVPGDGNFALASSRRGLHVLARTEEALVPPVDALLAAYGQRLEVGPPRARLIEGMQVREPIMHLRICTQVQFFESVKRALAARGAMPSEEFVRSRYGVLRYEAPLADLLGLPAELGRLTLGSARHWIVLDRYAAVTHDPGGGKAA